MKTRNTLLLASALGAITIAGTLVFASDDATSTTITASASGSTSTSTATATGTTATGSTSSGSTSSGSTSTGTTASGSTSSGATATGATSGSGTTSLSKKARAALYASLMANLDQIRVNWGSFHSNNGFLSQYVRKDLSKAEKKSFLESVKQFNNNARLAYKTKIKELKERYKKANPDIAAIKTELHALIDLRMTSLKDAVSKYIAADKKAAFDQFIADRTATMKANADLRLSNLEARTNFKKQ